MKPNWNNEAPAAIGGGAVRLGDDLAEHLAEGAEVRIASHGFSLSAFERLEAALKRVRVVRRRSRRQGFRRGI